MDGGGVGSGGGWGAVGGLKQTLKHKVVPIFKAGDPNSVTNYQPISLLSNASKVLERLIFDKLIDHFTKSISPLQIGFTKNCSALQQMLIFLDEITNTPAQTDVIYFDISKAFDSVSQSTLLRKLWYFSITGTLWTWIKDYLSNRCQRVIVIPIHFLLFQAFHKVAFWAHFYSSFISMALPQLFTIV